MINDPFNIVYSLINMQFQTLNLYIMVFVWAATAILTQQFLMACARVAALTRRVYIYQQKATQTT